jgi:hypothetical protein
MTVRTFRPWIFGAAILALALPGCGGGSVPNTALGQAAHNAAGDAAGGTALSANAHKLALGVADARMRAQHLLQTSSATASMRLPMNEPDTADMPVTRPHETPCIVQLFNNYSFEDYNNHTFNYAPPGSPCAGPWNKVVLDVNLDVSAGVQYDRTGSIWINGTNVWFGTTAEPGSSLSPKWHVERDVTDLAPIFTTASVGNAFIGNNMCCGLTGVIYATAQLEFYPATSQYPAADTPDAVYSLANPPPGNNTYVGPYESPSLSGTFSFPQNVERAYLDVYLQGQSSFDNYPLQGFDEFWYSCLPNDLAQKMYNSYGLYQCEGTGLREGEVAIDGQPAGVAPIYPWIFTGGWDPFLWIPIPGLETLNFNPYRVDLTPFAGLLDNGSQHTVSITVFNDQDYFSSNAELLLYEDHGQSVDTGYVKANGTSANPVQSVSENVTFGSSALSGPVTVNSSHHVYVDGVLNTSHGTVETRVSQDVTFSQTQNLNVAYNGLSWIQDIQQKTGIMSLTQQFSGGSTTSTLQMESYPFTIDYDFTPNSNGYQQLTRVSQGKQTSVAVGGRMPFNSQTTNQVNSTDTLLFNSSFQFIGSKNGKSSQQFTYRNNNGGCYNKTFTSANYTLTGDTGGFC